jgi:CRP/FNR family transcriptional regulator
MSTYLKSGMQMISQSLKMSSASISPAHIDGESTCSAISFPRLHERADGAAGGYRLAELIGEFAATRRLRKPGDYLFRVGSAFQFFFVLSAGFAKCRTIAEDGRERTIGIYLRGDILGLDAVATGTHGCDAVALDACEIMAIPYYAVVAGCQRNPELVHEFHRAFSAEIRRDRDQMLSMMSLSAEARVGSFLLEMSMRFASRGFSSDKLRLQLTRQEIGSMLGLQLETVSRAFSRLAKLGLITVCLREIVLLDREQLREYCSRSGRTEAPLHLSSAIDAGINWAARLRPAEFLTGATAA